MQSESPALSSAPYFPYKQEQGIISLPAPPPQKSPCNFEEFFLPLPSRFHKELLCPAMEFFILLVLAFCCCRAGPLQTQDLDCDDPAVFNAVDLALQEFNGRSILDHKSALVVVDKARRITGPDASFFIEVAFRVEETVCSIGEDIPWQKCEFRVPAARGNCEAQVYFDNLRNFLNVSQACGFVPGAATVAVTHATCTGCWTPLSPDNLQLLPLVRYTIRRFNNQTSHPSLFEVLEITKAQSQVVAGWKYAFEYLVKETNCSKAKFPDLTPECKRIPEGRVGKCIAVAHVNIRHDLSFAVQDCRLQVEEEVSRSRSCPGCPRHLPTNSTQLKEPMKAALETHNSKNNTDAYYEVEEILDATVQVVAGTKYQVEFIIVKTNCTKDDFRKQSEDCHPENNGERQHCTASIHVIPWQLKIFPNVTCVVSEHRAMAYAAWPPGMTPFRSLRLAETSPPMESKRMTANQKAHPSGSRRGLGSVVPPALGHHHGQGQTKETSAEDSREGVGKQGEISLGPVAKILNVQPSLSKPCLQEEEANEGGAGCPTPPSQQESTSDSPDFSNSDLVSDAPKCPGKPWKPITTDPELAFGVGDNQATLPPDQQDLTLADALGL
ncbi:kininogen-1 [Heteronotia binoei]|uniref:kininogen-1 n=1 Tax=Heteronotia binoei TaxID=13085 RepID=UPI00293162F9|nr:kininogen-1 [Heteronotia binoei]